MKVTSIILCLMLSATFSFAGHHEEGGKKGKRFKEMDTDGDNKLSKSEFMAAQEKRFAKMDANSDGFVTRDEKKSFKKMKKAMKKKNKK